MNNNRRKPLWLLACASTVLLAACTGAPPPSPSGSATEAAELTVLTPDAKSDAGDLTWAMYRELQTLDPIQSYDYPENTVLPNLCDSLLRTNPDMSVGPGIASYTNPSPTEFDFTINPNAVFWDGSPVTAEDAVFSLKRAGSADAGSFFVTSFDRVASYEVTGDRTFKIVLTEPDYWLLGNLASTPGVILSQKFVEAQGQDYGRPAGGTMCSGPFKLESWETGKGAKIVPNGSYWDDSLPKPRVSSITFIGVPDDATLTAGLSTGSISGTYLTTYTTAKQLQGDSALNVYQGSPFLSAALQTTTTTGAMSDVRVRQAIQLAVDRKGLISAGFGGLAQIPHALQGPGTWGYGVDVFNAGYEALPALDQDLAKAKTLIEQAGAAGKPIRILTTTENGSLNALAVAFQNAAKTLGLDATLKNVTASDYINYFFDPQLTSTIDALPTITYGLASDPAWIYSTLTLPGGGLNLNQYSNPAVTSALESARVEPDEAKRAQFVVDAQKTITEEAPIVTMVLPNNVLVMNKEITGAPATGQYLLGPWAVYLGGS